MQETVFAFGIVTALVQFALFLYFLRVKSHFAICFAMMCLAEACASIVTTAFSVTSVVGVYGQLSPELVIGLRTLIFGPLLASSLFLAWKVKTA